MRRTASRLAPVLALLALAPTAAADPAVDRFAAALRFETVSPADPADFRGEPFVALHAFLAESFPRVHAALEREVVADYSLLYTWPGSDASAEPVLLTSHLDVVPVPDDTLDAWEQPPFGGVVADGFVWGRGALDDKVGVLATLEAVERLLVEGFAPARTLYLAFGHDEELGGPAGAAAITDLLDARGVRLAWSLDEGMVVIEGGILGEGNRAAMIGVAEKGSVTLEVTARAPGGHSSMPPREGAIGRLARAISRIEAHPMPARMETIAGRTLDALAPEMGGVRGLALRNRWLLGPLIERMLAASPSSDALLRTTTAVTMVNGGVKSNVLPRSATAVVNFRILPGDTIEGIVAHVREVVDDPEIEIVARHGREASEVSRTDSEGYRAIATAIGEVFPDAVQAPGLVLGGTDSKQYGRIADDSYRFAPLELGMSDLSRIHGVNERMSVAGYGHAVDFYAALLRGAAGPRTAP